MPTFEDEETGLNVRAKINASITKTDLITVTQAANLDTIQKYLGTYTSLLALQTAHATATDGNYADVDGGVGSDVKRYIWDSNDNKWVELLGASSALTDAQVKTQYENNSDTNAFTDAEKTKLAGIEENATEDQTAEEIKTEYESNDDTNVFTDKEKARVELVDFNYLDVNGLAVCWDGNVTDVSSGWPDKSGNGITAPILDGTPTVDLNSINGLNTIVYDNNSSFALPSELLNIPTGDHTVIVTIKRDADGPQDRIINFSSGGTVWDLRFSPTSGKIIYLANAAQYIEITGVITTEYNVITARREGDNVFLSVNGGAEVSGSVTGYPSPTVGAIGRFSGASQEYIDGNILSIAMFRRSLTAEESDRLISYELHRANLASKIDSSSDYKDFPYGLENKVKALDSKKADKSTIEPIAFAVASAPAQALEQKLLAENGQLGKTILAVPFTTSGKVQVVSLGAGNTVTVFASGTDFTNGKFLYREFLREGEVICFTGVLGGAIITGTEGIDGHCEVVSGTHETDMRLLSLALGFTKTFLYAFRNSTVFSTTPLTNNAGVIFVVNGPVRNTIKLTFGDGTVVQGQENIELEPWGYTILGTSGNVEYILLGTNLMMAAIMADETAMDGRPIMPLTNDGITWPRSGFVSALYNNTQVDFWVRDGAEGRLNSTLGTGVSPNFPVDFDAAIGVGTGANDSDYFPNGATRVRATGLISAYSGADGAGGNASPMLPTKFMSQVVAQPLYIADSGDADQSSVSIASPYEGTARIYEWNDTTNQLDLAYTVPLTRNGVTVTSKEDQFHPASGQVSNNTGQNGVVPLVGQLNPGLIKADVPITVIVQNSNGSLTPTVRSQNGTTTTAIVSDDDEMLCLGITPEENRPLIREGTDGILYKFIIDGNGIQTGIV